MRSLLLRFVVLAVCGGSLTACAQASFGDGPTGREQGPDAGNGDPIDDPDEDGPVNPTDDDPPIPTPDAGTPPEVSVRDGLLAVAVGIAAQRSAEEKRPVELAELGL